jgi:hypothetical protein
MEQAERTLALDTPGVCLVENCVAASINRGTTLALLF